MPRSTSSDAIRSLPLIRSTETLLKPVIAAPICAIQELSV
jgi:hypothetical protein